MYTSDVYDVVAQQILHALLDFRPPTPVDPTSMPGGGELSPSSKPATPVQLEASMHGGGQPSPSRLLGGGPSPSRGEPSPSFKRISLMTPSYSEAGWFVSTMR